MRHMANGQRGVEGVSVLLDTEGGGELQEQISQPLASVWKPYSQYMSHITLPHSGAELDMEDEEVQAPVEATFTPIV
jgi:hypothetical protein